MIHQLPTINHFYACHCHCQLNEQYLVIHAFSSPRPNCQDWSWWSTILDISKKSYTTSGHSTSREQRLSKSSVYFMMHGMTGLVLPASDVMMKKRVLLLLYLYSMATNRTSFRALPFRTIEMPPRASVTPHLHYHLIVPNSYHQCCFNWAKPCITLIPCPLPFTFCSPIDPSSSLTVHPAVAPRVLLSLWVFIPSLPCWISKYNMQPLGTCHILKLCTCKNKIKVYFETTNAIEEKHEENNKQTMYPYLKVQACAW